MLDQIRKHIMKSNISALLCIMVLSCNNVDTPEFTNPFDPRYVGDKPNPPSELEVESISESEVLLSWADNSGIEEGFTIERTPEGGDFIQVGSVNPNSQQFNDSGLDKSKSYLYRIIAFSHNDESIYSNPLKIEYLEKTDLIRRYDLSDGITSVAISSSGKYLAAVSAFDNMSVWDIHSGRVVLDTKLDGNASGIREMIFSDDNKLLAAYGGSVRQGSLIIIWDTDGFLKIKTFATRSRISSIKFSPNKQLLAAANGSRVSIWDINSGQFLYETLSYVTPFIHFLSNNKILYFRGTNEDFIVWDINTDETISYELHSPINSVAYHPESDMIAFGGLGKILLWNFSGANLVTELIGHSGYVLSIDFSFDGLHLVSVDKKRTIRFWDIQTGVMTEELQTNGFKSDLTNLKRVDVSFDGGVVALGGNDETVSAVSIKEQWLQR